MCTPSPPNGISTLAEASSASSLRMISALEVPDACAIARTGMARLKAANTIPRRVMAQVYHRVGGWVLVFSADQIRKETVGTGDPIRKLPEKSITGIDECSLPHFCHDHSSLLRLFAGICTLENRGVLRIPGAQEVVSTLLNPPVEICRRNLVGKIENPERRIENLYRGLFIRHPTVVIDCEWKWPEWISLSLAVTVVLHDK